MVGEILTVDQFYEIASTGKLLGLTCSAGHVTVPPRRSCIECDDKSLKKIELSGYGKVISWTQVFVKSKEFPLNVPYVLALVRLDEGGNLMGVIEGPDSVRYESRVSVSFRKLNEKEWPRIFFELIPD
jgi:uncharacterized protein